MTPRVAIVGGGYAGLAAAVELAAAGINVCVYEGARQLGGRARRVDHLGISLDNGLHILIGAYRETLRLIRTVHPNPDSALLRMPLDWRVLPDFRLAAPHFPAPWHLLAAIIRAQGLSATERFSIVRFMSVLRAIRFRLRQDVSVNALLKDHRQNDNVCRTLWRPLCIAALNTPPEVASAQVFLNVLRDGLNGSRDASDILVSRVDLSALFPDPAAAWITCRKGEVRNSQRVTRIKPTDGGFAVNAAGDVSQFSHVICALPPHQVSALLDNIAGLADTTAMIDKLQYQPIHSVWLQYPRSLNLPYPMLGMSGGVVQWLFDREQLCGQRGLAGVVISARGAHQSLPQPELARQVHEELRQHIKNLPQPEWHRVIAEKRATFSCTTDVRRPACITSLPNFFLAGDYTAGEYPATIEGAVRSGVACARAIRLAHAD